MALCYVAQQGATVSCSKGRLNVRLKGRLINWMHLKDLEGLVLCGNVNLTPGTIRFALQNGIDTVFLSIHGKYRGKLVAEPGKNIQLRKAQFQRLEHPEARLSIAGEIVRAKLINSRHFLRGRNARYPNRETNQVNRRLGGWIEETQLAENLDMLRGIEGAAAASYFSVLNQYIRRPGFEFTKRTRRPPRDRTNCILSFVYTLLTNRCADILHRVGLDPCLGALHSVVYGRPSLALDLIEPLRPLADALSLEAINKRIIRIDHFQHRPEIMPLDPDREYEELEETDYPVLLSPSGLKTLVYHFETALSRKRRDPEEGGWISLNQIMERQARKVANALLQQEERIGAYIDEASFYPHQL